MVCRPQLPEPPQKQILTQTLTTPLPPVTPQAPLTQATSQIPLFGAAARIGPSIAAIRTPRPDLLVLFVRFLSIARTPRAVPMALFAQLFPVPGLRTDLAIQLDLLLPVVLPPHLIPLWYPPPRDDR